MVPVKLSPGGGCMVTAICSLSNCDSDNQVSDEKSEVLIQNCELGQEEQTSTDLFLWVINAYLFDFFTYKKIEHSLQTFISVILEF